MALRVLLADESSTIKKVLQLALSDFGVEVKSVPSGIDVLTVTQDFRPDIVFADVLLTKKNGYEVCAELKAQPQFKELPIILMWSGFMEFDEKQAQKAQYSARLEKPFDADTLRNLVTEFVPRLQDHPLKGMLEFGTLPQDPVIKPVITNERELKATPPMDFVNDDPIADLPEIPDLDSIFVEEVEDFQQEGFPRPIQPQGAYSARSVPKTSTQLTPKIDVPLPNSPQQSKNQFNSIETFSEASHSENHQHQDDFVFNADDVVIETENFGDFEEVVLVKTDKKHEKNLASQNAPTRAGLATKSQSTANSPATNQPSQTLPKTQSSDAKSLESELSSKIQTQLNQYLEQSPLGSLSAKNQSPSARSSEKLNDKYTELLLREEARIMAEKICWQVIPEIAEKIIREEIRKLLQDIDKSI